MSTTGVESWAVDLANVGAIYPFQGSEVVLAIAGIVAWLAWHFWQLGSEKRKYQEKIREHGRPENYRRVVEDGD